MRRMEPGNRTALPSDEVHIHILRVGADPGFPVSGDSLSPLSEEEVGHYQDFEPEEKRLEFLLSRLMIRKLGSFYLGKEPEDLKFYRKEGGKPFFAGTSLQFNLSHTQGLIACSFAWAPVGIDIENGLESNSRQRSLLARRYFSPEEKAFLLEKGSFEDTSADFLRIFTMKEAYGKALGKGLCFPLDQFSVPLPPSKKALVGEFEFFLRDLKPLNACLAHVVRKFKVPVRYKLFTWQEGSFSGKTSSPVCA